MFYCAIWIIVFKKNSVFRALALSVIPSVFVLCLVNYEQINSAAYRSNIVCAKPYLCFLHKNAKMILVDFKFDGLVIHGKILLEQVTCRWSYNRRPAVFGVYIIYECGKILGRYFVYINRNIFLEENVMVKEIKRDYYLEQLINREGNGLNKIVTGIRRIATCL